MRWGRTARYVRRVTRAFEGFSTASIVAYGSADRRLERLTPPVAPPRFAEAGERLRALEAEALGERADRTAPYPERARAVVAAMQAAAAQAEQLVAQAETPDEQRFATEVAERLAARREAFAAAAGIAERSGDVVLERLKRTIPPRHVAGEHAALVGALSEELDARRAVHAAAGALDPEASAAAGRDYEARHDDLVDAWQALAAELGSGEHRPWADA